jgi:hypothetical protein
MKSDPLIFGLLTLFSFSCSPDRPEGCFPRDYLPDHITPLTDFGQRSEWSLDGKSVFFVDRAGGDVWMVDIRTKKTRKITRPEYRPEGHGYYRVFTLANGDLLLTCGPERHDLYMQILDKSLSKEPVKIPDEQIDEGAAVSQNNMKIAWTPHQKKIYTGEIVYKEGIPGIKNKKLIIDNRQVEVDGIKYEGILEPQDFRPPDENELIWSQYGHDSRGIFTSEVMGYDLETGEIINYSRAPMQYDEPEGIFPDGQFTLVECDKHHPEGTAYIDIYKLKLDPNQPEYIRLTRFSEVEGYRSSNPVVRDDGKMIAFQASIAGSAAGAGCGLYLFDLEKFEKE